MPTVVTSRDSHGHCAHRWTRSELPRDDRISISPPNRKKAALVASPVCQSAVSWATGADRPMRQRVEMEEAVGMDVSNKQWTVLEPLIDTMPRRADGRGRPWRNRKRPKPQDGRPLRRYKRRLKIQRLFPWL